MHQPPTLISTTTSISMPSTSLFSAKNKVRLSFLAVSKLTIVIILLTSMMMMMMMTVVSSFMTTTTRTATRTISSSLFVSKNPADADDNNDNDDNKKKKKGSMGRGGNEGEEESEIDFQRRMAVVRSLQMTFYGTPSAVKPTIPTTKSFDDGENDDDTSDDDDDNVPHQSQSQSQLPEYEISTGTIKRLPLFRASFYEVPGRSNVLIIRDPIYTNMFERMFYTTSSSSTTHTTSTHTTSVTSFKSSSTYNGNSNKGSSFSPSNTVLPMMFGHVYMPKENREINNYKLSPWNETDYTTIADDDTDNSDNIPSVIGTIMYVRDYRRMKDGKILVLVQASDRFVIDYIHQSVPYSIADVKVIPDIEELQISKEKEEELVGVKVNVKPNTNNDEEQFIIDCFQADERLWIGVARNKAVKESIQKYHLYECNPNQKLHGIPTKLDLSFLDITHTALSDVLPYVPFSTTATDSIDSLLVLSNNSSDNINNNNEQKSSAFSSSSSPPLSSSSSVVELVAPSLELQLLSRGITKFPSFDQRFSASLFKSSFYPYKKITTNELEYQCWIVLDYFLLETNKTISPLLLELLPQKQQQQFLVDWPKDFTLKGKYDEYNNNINIKNKKDNNNNNNNTNNKNFVNVLPYNYPNHRRQRRFSYSVAYLLESILPIGMTTTTTTSTTGSSNNQNDSNTEGRYSDNFRNGGRRYSRKKETNDADADHDSYSDYVVDGDEIQQFRSILLAIPSTRQRLRFVLEKFYQWKLYL